jgi:hypothetical protein
VSLLLAAGHADARHYPVAHVWSEARIVRQRNALCVQRDAALMQLVIGSIFSKDTGKLLMKTLERMDESD